MVIDNKIERYVYRVTSCLPAHDRSRAAKEISEMITDLVRDYAGDHEPDILDARAVISELGSPEEMASDWLEQKAERTARESAGRSSRTAGESALTSAAAHLSDHLKEGLSGRRLPVMTLAGAQKIMSVTMAVIMVLAVLLVGFGLLALGTHTINTMLPIFLGCIMALVAVTGRSVLSREYR